MTLVEVIVVLAISGIVISLAVSVLLFGMKVFRKGNTQYDKQSDLRIAMDYIQNQVQLATYIEVTDDPDDLGATLESRERIYFDNGYLVHDKWDVSTSTYQEVYRSNFILTDTNFSQYGNVLNIHVQDTTRTESEYELSSDITLPNIINNGQNATQLHIIKFARGVESIGLVAGGGGGLITGVNIQQSTAIVEEGKSIYLNAIVSKTGFPDDLSVSWTSSNIAIASVDPSSGKVTGVSASGTQVTITATSNSNPTKFDTCLITVIPAAPADTTPPLASVLDTTLYRGEAVTTATSTEPGNIYLISAVKALVVDGKTTMTDKLLELAAAVSTNDARKASVGANISTTGLGPLGVYYVYAVDQSNNVSVRGSGSVTLKEHGPILTVVKTDAKYVTFQVDQTISDVINLSSTKPDDKLGWSIVQVSPVQFKVYTTDNKNVTNGAVVTFRVLSMKGGTTDVSITKGTGGNWSSFSQTPS